MKSFLHVLSRTISHVTPWMKKVDSLLEWIFLPIGVLCSIGLGVLMILQQNAISAVIAILGIFCAICSLIYAKTQEKRWAIAEEASFLIIGLLVLGNFFVQFIHPMDSVFLEPGMEYSGWLVIVLFFMALWATTRHYSDSILLPLSYVLIASYSSMCSLNFHLDSAPRSLVSSSCLFAISFSLSLLLTNIRNKAFVR